MGANEALHGIKFNGNNILTGGVNRDAYVVVPGGTFTGLMHAENVGMYPSCINLKRMCLNCLDILTPSTQFQPLGSNSVLMTFVLYPYEEPLPTDNRNELRHEKTCLRCFRPCPK